LDIVLKLHPVLAFSCKRDRIFHCWWIDPGNNHEVCQQHKSNHFHLEMQSFKVWNILRMINRPEKWPYFVPFFLLDKDILLLWYELGHAHKKILFYEENTFFKSQLHNCISKYLSIVQLFMCVPKYLTIAQFLPNSCLTFPAGNWTNLVGKLVDKPVKTFQLVAHSYNFQILLVCNNNFTISLRCFKFFLSWLTLWLVGSKQHNLS